MSKRNTVVDSIEITKDTFDKIMSWANALEEVVYLVALKDNKGCDAFRMINTSAASRNYFDYSAKDERALRKKIFSLGFDKVVLGHSHPSHNHVRHISKTDW